VSKITLILPAKNEAPSLPDVLRRIQAVLATRPDHETHEIVVVDDGSDDGTGEAAAAAGARVECHPYSMGNGAAIKTGIRAARGDTLLMMDADGQHLPEDIPMLLDALPGYAMVVGARTRGTGTGFHRGIANRIYNALATYVVKHPVEDLTSGFRVMDARAARRFVYLLPNTFSYPTTITLSFFRAGLPVRYVGIEAQPRVGKSHIRLFSDGSRFLIIILKISTIFSPLRVLLPMSAIAFAAGCGWYGYTFLSTGRFTNASQLAFVLSVLLFALAMISEQVAALRFDRSEDDQ
jgi:glycosyltransferase involved in cell wall biosynthesis